MNSAEILALFPLFISAITFTIMGIFATDLGQVIAFAVASVLWFVLAPVYGTLVFLDYPFIGLVFLIPGVFTSILTAHGIFQVWVDVNSPKWQREELVEE